MAELVNPSSSSSPAASPAPSAGPFRPSRSQSLTSGSSPSNPAIPLLSPNSSSPASPAAPESLIRRHHTLSTSSSRLIRGERSRARLALQEAGLSEADQQYYLPDSPVTATGPSNWPERRSEANSSEGASAWNAMTGASSLSTMVEGEPRSGGVSPALSTQSSTGTGNSNRNSASSFVVVRASKGDAPLAERKDTTRVDTTTAEQGSRRRQPVVTPPRHNSLSASLPAHAFGGADAGSQAESWNSLKGAEGNFEGDAEWEKSLRDEKARLFDEEDTVHRVSLLFRC